MILKLTLRCLVRMGYQCTFGVLQVSGLIVIKLHVFLDNQNVRLLDENKVVSFLYHMSNIVIHSSVCMTEHFGCVVDLTLVLPSSTGRSVWCRSDPSQGHHHCCGSWREAAALSRASACVCSQSLLSERSGG